MLEDISKVILFSDMDGTLLNSKKEITQKDLDAIKRFVSLGGKFTIATGRTVQTFEQYRDMLGIDIPIILFNGALIYDYSTKETLYMNSLPENAKDIALEILENMPEAGGEVLKADGTYVFRNNDYEQLHTDICKIVPNYSELKDIDSAGWLKVLFAMSPEEIPHMELLVHQNGYDSVDFVKSSDIFYEMLTQGVSKGSALTEYRKIKGYEDYTFAAIGDFDNDLEMIISADIGACPANAEESVKQKADIVLKSTCDEGAVAEFIEYLISNA
ncbi:MAG: Cof-type HAD-IIB family hydrolase [Ruminococcus sp.]|nr:Cof-type HAD-IIB family hydrolase [Ruminococcus sp.]